jgi:protein gp37
MKTKIEWCDYTINPVKGLCPVACSYCYARRMYKRFHWDETIRFDQTVFFNLPQKPSRIFVGSTMELFGDWVNPEWLQTIFTICRQHSEHTFIFLTKRPENLIKWSPFPDNCWVGVSVDDGDKRQGWGSYFSQVKAGVKFISFEPLLNIPNWWWIGGLAESFKRRKL